MHQIIIVINMERLQNLKIATIISFLIIVFPGKIAFINVIAIFLGLLDFFLMLGVEPINLYFIVSLLTIISLFLFFSKNKIYYLLALILQIFYIFFTFNLKFLNHWYYTIPTLAYLILSLVLIYISFFSEKENNYFVKLIYTIISSFYLRIIYILFVAIFVFLYILLL